MSRGDIAIAAIIHRGRRGSASQRPCKAKSSLRERCSARSINCSTLVPPSIAACSAARIRSAVRSGRARAHCGARLAQEGRQAPPFTRDPVLRLIAGSPPYRTARSRVAPDLRHLDEGRPGLSGEPREQGLDLRNLRDSRACRSLRPLRQSLRTPRSMPYQASNTLAVESATRGFTSSTGEPDTSPRSTSCN